MIEVLMSQRFLIAMGVGALIGSIVAATIIMALRWRERRKEPELEHLDIRGRRWEPMRLGIANELQEGDLVLYHDTWHEIIEIQPQNRTYHGAPTLKFLLHSKMTFKQRRTDECVIRVLKGRKAPEETPED